jgi:transcriptional regulator with XRE-family HTH domain
MTVTTGMDLKLDRIRERVSTKELAAQMGVVRQRIHQIEALAVVNPDLERRYRDALHRTDQEGRIARPGAHRLTR